MTSSHLNLVVERRKAPGNGCGGPTGVLAFTLQGEDTHDWETGEWWAPINFLVAKIVKIDGQPVRIVGGVRYWMDSPDNGPHGFGGRLGMTFLFPTR